MADFILVLLSYSALLDDFRSSLGILPDVLGTLEPGSMKNLWA